MLEGLRQRELPRRQDENLVILQSQPTVVTAASLSGAKPCSSPSMANFASQKMSNRVCVGTPCASINRMHCLFSIAVEYVATSNYD